VQPWLDDACSLAEAIRRREVRSADAVQASLDAIAGSQLNAVVHLDAEGALRRAQEIDAAIARGEDVGSFGGVPLLVKDLEDASGMPTTHGSVPYKDNIADHDSIHVSRLRAAGAVVLGKSAAPEFGLVAYTATKLHGVTRNPWNLERTPAGSSGGSAAAVAGGLVPLATASDGGGSIRLPAAYTGLVGLKGSFGRIPRGPRARTGSLTSVWGAVTRSVRDTTRWMDVASGYHPRDQLSLPRVDNWERDLGTQDLRGLRVTVMPDLGNAVIEPFVRDIVVNAAEQLIAETGMRRVEADVRMPEKGRAWAAAGAAGLWADLKQFWPDCEPDLTFEIAGSMRLLQEYRVWSEAAVQKFRMIMNEAMCDAFEQTDIILCAVSPYEPFRAEGPMPRDVNGEKVDPYNGGALTIPANISGFPAISIPAGLSPNGLPIGLQAYAARHGDKLLLDLALAMERARPWPLVAPGAPV
jgi:aspartyl-tRNA(Asn)/glutamyl-tRNA(Gln) amidotransferase subunit A